MDSNALSAHVRVNVGSRNAMALLSPGTPAPATSGSSHHRHNPHILKMQEHESAPPQPIGTFRPPLLLSHPPTPPEGSPGAQPFMGIMPAGVTPGRSLAASMSSGQHVSPHPSGHLSHPSAAALLNILNTSASHRLRGDQLDAFGGGPDGAAAGARRHRAMMLPEEEHRLLQLMNDHTDPLESSIGARVRAIEAVSAVEVGEMRFIFDGFSGGAASVPRTQLVPILRAMHLTVTEEQATELFSLIDTNDNGELEFEELLQLVIILKATAQYRLFAVANSKRTYGTDTCVPPFLTDQQWRWAWDTFRTMLLAAIFFSVAWLHIVTGPEKYVNHAVGPTSASAMYWFDLAVTVPLGLEILFQLNMAYPTSTRTLETRRLHIARRYAQTWLLPDLIAAVPFRILLADQHWLVSIAAGHLRLLALPRYLTFFRRSNHVGITPDYIHFHFFWLPLLILVLTFACAVVVSSVVWFRIYDGRVDYTSCVYATMYFFTGVGLGDIPVESTMERNFASVSCLMALLINGAVIGNIVALMGQADVEALRRTRLVETLAVLDYFDVPAGLQAEILQFQNHIYTKDVGKAYRALIDQLPAEIKGHMSLQKRLQLLRNVSTLRSAHSIVQIVLVQHFLPVVFCPEEYLVVAQEQIDEVYFINYGFADESSHLGFYARTLKTGDTVGEGVLYTPTVYECLTSVKALTYMEVFRLRKQEILSTADSFGQFKQQLAENAMLRLLEIATEVTRLAQANATKNPRARMMAEQAAVEAAAALEADMMAGSGPVYVSGSRRNSLSNHDTMLTLIRGTQLGPGDGPDEEFDTRIRVETGGKPPKIAVSTVKSPAEAPGRGSGHPTAGLLPIGGGGGEGSRSSWSARSSSSEAACSGRASAEAQRAAAEAAAVARIAALTQKLTKLTDKYDRLVQHLLAKESGGTGNTTAVTVVDGGGSIAANATTEVAEEEEEQEAPPLPSRNATSTSERIAVAPPRHPKRVDPSALTLSSTATPPCLENTTDVQYALPFHHPAFTAESSVDVGSDDNAEAPLTPPSAAKRARRRRSLTRTSSTNSHPLERDSTVAGPQPSFSTTADDLPVPIPLIGSPNVRVSNATVAPSRPIPQVTAPTTFPTAEVEQPKH